MTETQKTLQAISASLDATRAGLAAARAEWNAKLDALVKGCSCDAGTHR